MVNALGAVGVLLVLQVPPPDSGALHSAQRVRERQAIRERETSRLNTLANHLRAQGQAAAADEVLRHVEPPPPANGASRFVPLPDVVLARHQGLANVPAAGQEAVPWRADLGAIRASTAQALFDLARRAASQEPKSYALADEALRAVLARQPDHPEARRLLGFVPHERGWATPFAVGRLRGGYFLHPTYGWVEKEWVPHLERGELPVPRAPESKRYDWRPAAVADDWHKEWAQAWQIPTEHFRIKSNAPLAEAIAFSRHLELFHDLFTSLLADVIGENLPLAQRSQGPKKVGEAPAKEHIVYYFRTKEEYVEHLLPSQGPSIEGTLGTYIPPAPGKGNRAPAYFFRDVGGQLPVEATLYHEVSHQLLFESGGNPNNFRKNAGNYWVFEGLGTYFETVEAQPDGSLQVGGLVGPRIEAARKQLARDGAFIPVARLVQLDQRAFQREEGIHVRYQEAMAVAVFLMQAEQGRYRAGFLEYAQDAFRGRLKRTTGRPLRDRIEIPYDRLDAEVLGYLQDGPRPSLRPGRLGPRTDDGGPG